MEGLGDGIRKLVKAISSEIPGPVPADKKPLLFTAQNVFNIRGAGPVINGKVQQGTLRNGEKVSVIGDLEYIRSFTVKEIQMFRRSLDEAHAGDECALLLDGVKRDEVKSCYVICEKGSRNFTRKFNALVLMEPRISAKTNTDIAVSIEINGTIIPAHIRFSPPLRVRGFGLQ